MSAEQIYKDNTYIERNPGWHESDTDWKYKQMKNLLSQVSFKSAADIGCGSGKLLENVLTDHPDADLSGFDITDNVHSLWQKRPAAIKFSNGDFFSTKMHYDLIFLIDVFEHVENYYEFLKKLSNRADRFIFHIPMDMCALSDVVNNYPQKRRSVGHLHYFNKSTAIASLEACGYNIIDYRITKAYLQSITKLNGFLLPFRVGFDLILGKNLNSRLMGGYSLMVLAEKAKQ